MPTQKFRVRGLRHEDEDRVARRAEELPGVLYAAASHGDECAEVEFEDDAVTQEEIRDAIAALGFRVDVAG